MSTADLIAAATPTESPPAWRSEAISIRPMGDNAASELDRVAAERGIVITEVARVSRQGIEVIYARASAPVLQQAAQFGQFLDRAIAETKTPSMNKFAELAARSQSLRKELDERADRLMKRLEVLPTLAEAAFAKHEGALDEHESGIKSMEDALRDLTGHNS